MNTSTFLKTLVLLSFVMLFGCRTVSIQSAKDIRIPGGLDKQAVKLAIISAVYPNNGAREWTPMEKMTDEALNSVLWFYKQQGDNGKWFVEELRENSVVVGYDNGKHYFRVEYIVTDSVIQQRIDGSRNLSQTSRTIHKAVFEWLGQMESKIRESMGMLSAKLNAGEGLNP